MSSIEWTDQTWNPVTGCTRVSAGCDNCYAVRETFGQERRFGSAKYSGLTVLNEKGHRHFNGVVRCHEEELDKPLRWRKPRKVFVNSMSDLFHPDVPFEFIDKVFAVMALCLQHTFQVLTKRPERMAEYFSHKNRDTIIDGAMWDMIVPKPLPPEGYKRNRSTHPFVKLPLPNVCLGTSVENQAAADSRILHLLHCPAAVRFLSCEPLLGAIEFEHEHETTKEEEEAEIAKAKAGRIARVAIAGVVYRTQRLKSIHWVIVGGESGPGARPCNVEWIRSIVRQCDAARVPVFVKQLGKKPFEQHSRERVFYTDLGPKGGDWDLWPEELNDLKRREFPTEMGV